MPKLTVVKEAHNEGDALNLLEVFNVLEYVAVVALSVSAHSKLLSRALTHSQLVLDLDIRFKLQVFLEVFLCKEPGHTHRLLHFGAILWQV